MQQFPRKHILIGLSLMWFYEALYLINIYWCTVQQHTTVIKLNIITKILSNNLRSFHITVKLPALSWHALQEGHQTSKCALTRPSHPERIDMHKRFREEREW